MGLKLDALERELRSADPRREKEAQKTLVKRVCPELGWLREYVVLNYTAVVKAVKKGNKNHIKVVFGNSLDEMDLGGLHKWCHVLAPIKTIAETH